MKRTFNKSKTTIVALGALLSLLGRGQNIDSNHTSAPEKKPALTYDGVPRTPQLKSPYDVLIEKIEEWTKNSEDGSHAVEVSGDELTVHLSAFEAQSTVASLKLVKQYRDAVEKKCKGIDESAALLLNTIDYCLVNNVILPAVNKSKLEQNRYETKISSKAINTCHDELAAFFSEKEKRTDLTEKDLFKADQEAAKSLAYIFERFGAKKDSKDSKDSSIIDNSELVKSIKKVEASNLCQVKLESSNSAQKEEPKSDKKPEGKPKADSLPKSSQLKQNKSVFEETITEEETREEIYQPLAAKKVVDGPKPVPQQPIQQPAPVYQQPGPTYQPSPYQPVPYKPKTQEFEPAPRPRNNQPAFVPAPAPAPRRAVVGGPGPVPIAGVPIARSFGLSLGFGSYNSTIQPMPAPMPYYPPMPMGSGMMTPVTGGGLTGISSSPRACLVCSSTPTVMPTLGLNTMMARPCSVQRVGVQPIGACLPNMNQPIMGYQGVNPYWNQIPRYPGAPVIPGTVNQPTIGGGSVIPNQNIVPRTNSTMMRRTQRRVRR